MNFIYNLANAYVLTQQNDVINNLRFTTENLPTALGMMVRGMLGIFVGLITIYLASIGLQKLFPAKENE